MPKSHTSPIAFAPECRYPIADSDYLGESEGEEWRAVEHFLSALDADKIQALRTEDPESHHHPPHTQGVTKGFPRAKPVRHPQTPTTTPLTPRGESAPHL